MSGLSPGDLPISFPVEVELAAVRFRVRSTTGIDLWERIGSWLLDVVSVGVPLIAVGFFFSVHPRPLRSWLFLGPLVTAFAIPQFGLVGVVGYARYSVGRVFGERRELWRLGLFTFLLAVGMAFAYRAGTLLVWGAFVGFVVHQAWPVVRTAFQALEARQVRVSAHQVEVDHRVGPVTVSHREADLRTLAPRLHGTSVELDAGLVIPMAAHAPWERQWVVELVGGLRDERAGEEASIPVALAHLLRS